MRHTLALLLALVALSCGGDDDGPAGASGSAGTSGTAGASAGSSGSSGTAGTAGTPLCTPGQSIACTCPGGAQGGQACKQDGSGYETCECGSSGTAGSAGADPCAPGVPCEPGEVITCDCGVITCTDGHCERQCLANGTLDLLMTCQH